MKQVIAPITYGSGVQVVHGMLEARIAEYQVKPITPRRALLPMSLKKLRPNADTVIHSLPDLGGYGFDRKLPLVVTFHGFYLDGQAMASASIKQRLFYRQLLQRYVARAVRRAQKVTAVSEFTAQLVEKHFGCAVDVIANGVDSERYSPSEQRLTDRRLRVLFSGNLRTQKGFDVVTRLAHELQDCCELLIAAGLRGGASVAKSLPGNITLLGRVEHDAMPQLYRDVDVLLLPTLREGMSLVTLEAMSSGLPVVTTDIAAQRLLISSGEGGYLLPVGDHRGFAKVLRHLAIEPRLREAMGQFNRDRVLESYQADRMAEQYRQLFELL